MGTESAKIRTSTAGVEDRAGGRIRPEAMEDSGKGGDVIRLSPAVVRALVSGGSFDKRLVRMGLTEREIGEVKAIREQGIKEFKNLESNHSRLVSDENGERIEIRAFPSERGRWLEDLDDRLGDLLQDDRSRVVADMIAAADNDEDVGIYRRELFITGGGPGDTKIKIEERSYDDSGNHFDSDFELVDSKSKSRWNHLLDFGDN